MAKVFNYFNLDEEPFGLGPNPRFLYLTPQVKMAKSKCKYMAVERVAPIYMYGPIGTGKTTILRSFHDDILGDDRFNIAYTIAPNLKTTNAFLKLIMQQFKVKTHRSYDVSLKLFQNFLREENVQGKIPLLLMDEAQNLSRDTLKLIHYMLNYETSDKKLLQIVLAGQEELAQKVLKYRELSSRMFPIAMHALTLEELKAMIYHRWKMAGGHEEEIPFEQKDDVFRVISDYSHGLPRDAVKLCDDILRFLVSYQKKKISPEETVGVAESLNMSK